jgi:predicted small lipoprotein YifL
MRRREHPPGDEERGLTRNLLSVSRALAIALVLPLALAACGRKGPLDPPPSAELPPAPPPGPASSNFIDPTTPTGGAQQAPVQTTQAAPVAQPPKKTFLLDPLIQ